jgi:hypothetical protein
MMVPSGDSHAPTDGALIPAGDAAHPGCEAAIPPACFYGHHFEPVFIDVPGWGWCECCARCGTMFKQVLNG